MPLLLAILIGASIWIYTYTSWFPIFGSLLGFGGVLIVVPALQGLMSEDRRKAYSAWVDQLLFQNRTSARLYIISLIIGFAIGFLLIQPLRLANGRIDGSIEAHLSYSQTAGDPPERIIIGSGKTHALPLRQPFAGGPAKAWISAPGLPTLEKELTGFGWPKVELPDDLWRQPIVLLRAGPGLLIRLTRVLPRFDIVVSRKNKGKLEKFRCTVQQKYVGEPLWIGGGLGEISLSEARYSRWLREFELANLRGEVSGNAQLILRTPIRPQCEESRQVMATLRMGDVVSWTLASRTSGEVLSQGEATLTQAARFPLEIKMVPQ